MTREKILETALRQHKMKTQRTCCLDFSENLAMDLIWADKIDIFGVILILIRFRKFCQIKDDVLISD